MFHSPVTNNSKDTSKNAEAIVSTVDNNTTDRIYLIEQLANYLSKNSPKIENAEQPINIHKPKMPRKKKSRANGKLIDKYQKESMTYYNILKIAFSLSQTPHNLNKLLQLWFGDDRSPSTAAFYFITNILNPSLNHAKSSQSISAQNFICNLYIAFESKMVDYTKISYISDTDLSLIKNTVKDTMQILSNTAQQANSYMFITNFIKFVRALNDCSDPEVLKDALLGLSLVADKGHRGANFFMGMLFENSNIDGASDFSKQYYNRVIDDACLFDVLSYSEKELVLYFINKLLFIGLDVYDLTRKIFIDEKISRVISIRSLYISSMRTDYTVNIDYSALKNYKPLDDDFVGVMKGKYGLLSLQLSDRIKNYTIHSSDSPLRFKTLEAATNLRNQILLFIMMSVIPESAAEFRAHFQERVNSGLLFPQVELIDPVAQSSQARQQFFPPGDDSEVEHKEQKSSGQTGVSDDVPISKICQSKSNK